MGKPSTGRRWKCSLATILPCLSDIRRADKSVRADIGFGQVDVAVLRPKKPRSAGDIRVTHDDIGWHAFRTGSTLASAALHSTYNLTFFAAYVVSGTGL